MSSYGKKDEIYGFQTLYREIGYYISRLEQYERSLKFFDEALAKTPDDKRALIGRSRARARAIQYAGALEDINKALGMDADDLIVLADKALNTYLCCEFEEGLVQNSKLVHKRQKPDTFVMGVMHCADAIENCVGERTGRPLRDHFKIIRRLAWKRNYDAQKHFQPIPRKKNKKKLKTTPTEKLEEPAQPLKFKLSEKDYPPMKNDDESSIKDSLYSNKTEKEPIPPFTKPFPYKPLQNYTTNIENFMAEKYLASMYLDKIFLKKLQTEPGANCPNEKGAKKIKQLANNGFKIVSYKQELLRTRRPFYFIKYQEATCSEALKERQMKELQKQQEITKKAADIILTTMQNACENKKLRLVIEYSEKLKQYCDVTSRKLLPDKNKYLKEIYENVCNAFYDIYRFKENMGGYAETKRIYVVFGIEDPVAGVMTTDSVIEEFRDVFINYKKLARTFEERLEVATDPCEVCWCYHELSRSHIELKKFELGRVYARKCIQLARQISNLRWRINGSMLLLKSNFLQHNKSDAKNDILDAIKIAEELGDNKLVEYLNKCSDIADRLEFGETGGTKDLEMREKKIEGMMSTIEMKSEIAHLFRTMAAMPINRRMAVIPGIQAEGTKKYGKAARKMSIMPGHVVADAPSDLPTESPVRDVT